MICTVCHSAIKINFYEYYLLGSRLGSWSLDLTSSIARRKWFIVTLISFSTCFPSPLSPAWITAYEYARVTKDARAEPLQPSVLQAVQTITCTISSHKWCIDVSTYTTILLKQLYQFLEDSHLHQGQKLVSCSLCWCPKFAGALAHLGTLIWHVVQFYLPYK